MTIILYTASEPANPNPIETINEFNKIEEKIKTSRFREDFTIKSIFSVSYDKFIESIDENKPNIVHFSGHGTEKGKLVFCDDNGKLLTTKKRIIEFFKIITNNKNNNLECVVLDACYSEILADEILKYVECVIGIRNQITPNTATEFFVDFYGSLSNQNTISDAFDITCNKQKFGRSVKRKFVLKCKNNSQQKLLNKSSIVDLTELVQQFAERGLSTNIHYDANNPTNLTIEVFVKKEESP